MLLSLKKRKFKEKFLSKKDNDDFLTEIKSSDLPFDEGYSSEDVKQVKTWKRWLDRHNDEHPISQPIRQLYDQSYFDYQLHKLRQSRKSRKIQWEHDLWPELEGDEIKTIYELNAETFLLLEKYGPKEWRFKNQVPKEQNQVPKEQNQVPKEQEDNEKYMTELKDKDMTLLNDSLENDLNDLLGDDDVGSFTDFESVSDPDVNPDVDLCIDEAWNLRDKLNLKRKHGSNGTVEMSSQHVLNTAFYEITEQDYVDMAFIIEQELMEQN